MSGELKAFRSYYNNYNDFTLWMSNRVTFWHWWFVTQQFRQHCCLQTLFSQLLAMTHTNSCLKYRMKRGNNLHSDGDSTVCILIISIDVYSLYTVCHGKIPLDQLSILNPSWKKLSRITYPDESSAAKFSFKTSI